MNSNNDINNNNNNFNTINNNNYVENNIALANNETSRERSEDPHNPVVETPQLHVNLTSPTTYDNQIPPSYK